MMMLIYVGFMHLFRLISANCSFVISNLCTLGENSIPFYLAFDCVRATLPESDQRVVEHQNEFIPVIPVVENVVVAFSLSIC